MSLLSRCQPTDRFETAPQPRFSSRSRAAADGRGFRSTFADFAEEIWILFRYAAGLDYYDRQNFPL